MRNLPLNLQILAAPTVLAIPIIAVLIFTLLYLNDISEQNDMIREWARATDQLKIAKSTDYQMLDLLNELSNIEASENSEKKEELFFNYIEQYQFLKTSLTSSDIIDKIPEADLFLFSTTLEDTLYSESIDIPTAILSLQTLSPKIDYIYNTLQAKKRSLYVKSNRDITKITSKLTHLILIVLGIATFLAVIISALVSTNLRKRLASISRYATDILDGTPVENNSNELISKNKDELNQISAKLKNISQRLNNTIESEQIMQAAEDERQRIAMDIHDQFLSEITQLRRDINTSKIKGKSEQNLERELKTIDSTLERLNIDLRSLINDLFPHSLEMLGLEASIRDYIKRNVSLLQSIEFYIQIDEKIEKHFTHKQCLHLYRISIEAINNIFKHARCNRFELAIKIINQNIVLTIEDNGVGFDFTQINFHGHMGLLSIKQRASILKSEAVWQASRFSTGTCLKIVFEHHENKDEKTTSPTTSKDSPIYA